ncbi:MAG TPA: hypothetical protein VKP30_27480, partial [Polyangiaceae bacterium]|nr:hypothetical protein [Polyangiaceae bacterium]
LAALEWSIDSERLTRKRVAEQGRGSIDYGTLGSTGGASSAQLRELMRQQETQRRGSSCFR